MEGQGQRGEQAMETRWLSHKPGQQAIACRHDLHSPHRMDMPPGVLHEDRGENRSMVSASHLRAPLPWEASAHQVRGGEAMRLCKTSLVRIDVSASSLHGL